VVIVDNYHSQGARAAVTAVGDEHGWTVLAMPANVGFGFLLSKAGPKLLG